MKVNILADQSGKILSVGYMDSSPELILGNKSGAIRLAHPKGNQLFQPQSS